MIGSFGGLRLDQAPPLSIPAAFFATAPAAMIAAGGLVVVYPEALANRWAGPALALTHLGTLGLLAATMMGALYQLLPVVGGAPVPAVRLAHVVHVLFVGGLAGMVAGFCGAGTLGAGAVAVGAALVLFGGPLALALARAPARTWTVAGMRFAGVALAIVAAMGLRMALLPPNALRPLWIEAHLAVGLLAWVGGLIAAVGWQLVPMFYLVPAFDRRVPPVVLGLQALGVAGVLAALGLAEAGVPVGAEGVLLAATPAALGSWGVQPVAVLAGLRRIGRAPDGSVRFWLAAMPVALALGPLAVVAHVAADPRWDLAFGWLAVWGWAGTLVHGMLTRIVPFLTWYHRFSSKLGKARVPAMRQFYPDARVRAGFAIHVATTVAGLAGIATGVAWPAGVGLVATGGWLGWHLVGVWRPR